MASAVAIDGRRGPALPRAFPTRRERERPQERKSPLPDDWSEMTRPFRELVRELEKLGE